MASLAEDGSAAEVLLRSLPCGCEKCGARIARAHAGAARFFDAVSRGGWTSRSSSGWIAGRMMVATS